MVFKQKTAYEIGVRLVGSEMCIRDRPYWLQYSISKKTRTTVSLSSMQGLFTESSLRKQAWRNPKEGRVGFLSPKHIHEESD